MSTKKEELVQEEPNESDRFSVRELHVRLDSLRANKLSTPSNQHEPIEIISLESALGQKKTG